MTSPAPKSGGNKTLFIILAIVGGILLLGCLCCGGLSMCTSWGTSWVSQKTQDGSLVETVTGGKVSTARLNPNFPKDVPVYPDGTIQISGGDKGNSMVQLLTRKSAADVMAYYARELEGQGWEKQTEFNTAEQSVVVYTKDTRTVSVQVMKTNGGESLINVGHENN